MDPTETRPACTDLHSYRGSPRGPTAELGGSGGLAIGTRADRSQVVPEMPEDGRNHLTSPGGATPDPGALAHFITLYLQDDTTFWYR